MNPSTRGSVSPPGGGASRQSYSRSASNCSDDRASDFEDEPVPYCQSHMEEIHDAPTPVGNLVDRVQVCRGAFVSSWWPYCCYCMLLLYCFGLNQNGPEIATTTRRPPLPPNLNRLVHYCHEKVVLKTGTHTLPHPARWSNRRRKQQRARPFLSLISHMYCTTTLLTTQTALNRFHLKKTFPGLYFSIQ